MSPTMADGKISYVEIPAAPIEGDAPEITARFRDPGGNVLGIYQQPS